MRLKKAQKAKKIKKEQIKLMKKRIFCVILTFLMMMSAVMSLTSCSDQPPELEPIKDRLIFLIEESKELNVIFFGNGLPVYRKDGVLSERKMVYYNDSMGNYERIMENSHYVSIDQIKIDAARIYSTEYLEEVYESAFDGVMVGETNAYVRFYDNGDFLCQNVDFFEFTLTERIYDYSTMEIVAPYSQDYINLKIEAYSIVDNVRKEVSLSFALENGEWYLDSPTY